MFQPNLKDHFNIFPFLKKRFLNHETTNQKLKIKIKGGKNRAYPTASIDGGPHRTVAEAN